MTPRQPPKASDVHALGELESLLGILSSYTDGTGTPRQASLTSRLAILRALGIGITTPAEAAVHVARLRGERAVQPCEPVHVAWDGDSNRISLQVPPQVTSLACQVQAEDGAMHAWTIDATADRGAASLHNVAVSLPALPWGYHAFRAEAPGFSAACLVIRAPRTCQTLPAGDRHWMPFVPVYALRGHSQCGTLRDLRGVMEWARGLGALAVATLPLNAVFLDRPYDPSPYAPVSRRFWNELYLDVDAVPEAMDPAVRQRLADSRWQAEARRLAEGDTCDLRAIQALRRPVLAAMAQALQGSPDRSAELGAWLARHPDAAQYAAFRAATERHGGWHGWPATLHEAVAAAKPGSAPPGADAWDAEAVAYHVAVQFWMDAQLAAIKQASGKGGAGLALDLPVGSHPDGYDAWRDRGAYARGASVGAPPDLMARQGQDWGFPPPHPVGGRSRGYEALRSALQAQTRHASLLRIDHAMGLHRLYWIPHGHPPDDGVYVTYPHDEVYAILCLESRRAGCVLFGEDLGTVPPDVPVALRRHGLLRMHVLTMESEIGAPSLPSPSSDQVAYLDTHDTPPFAMYWSAEDLDRLETNGQMAPAEAAAARRRRAAVRSHWRAAWRLPPGHTQAAAALQGALSHLAASEAPLVVINLEDLWLDPRPQNQPGTGPETANWCRRLAVDGLPATAADLLASVDRQRRRRPAAGIPAGGVALGRGSGSRGAP